MATSSVQVRAREQLGGSVILITGGTGSFGNRVAGQLLEAGPSAVRIYSRDEKKQSDMSQAFPDFQYVVGDIRDSDRLYQAMRGVDHVFHAAALKQVPSCEAYPYEAIKTNVIGSQNVCEAASRRGVKTVVALSTDKAVKPVNAMGMSKALMEKVVCAQNIFGFDTLFCCVRYGNVMGSRGSVIPLFRSLIDRSAPLPVTQPNMTRFLLTLDESVDLVMHALTNAEGGEIFVRKAPACTVGDLAKAMAMEYSEAGVDHPIEMVGPRPGEKIHEVLVNEYEMQRVTEAPDYYVVHPEYRLPAETRSYPTGTEYTSENTERISDLSQIIKLLRVIGQVEYYT